MEQFVLGIFQEQLGKFIVGFRKEMVNANLLNGKGEISNISLNCSIINEQLNSITPLIELDSIHISKVSFQVTSWTNLRKAPILVDIEHVTVHAAEPLHYLNRDKRRGIRQMTMSEMDRFFKEQAEAAAELKKNKTSTKNLGGPPPLASNPNKRGSYNLLDRIVDNLHVEVKSIFIDFQTWGKFKTRRSGPWTPPSLRIVLRNLKFTSVDEYGQEGTPDQIWAHNHAPQPRGQERTLIVFKKTSMEYDFGIRTSDGQLFSFLKGGFGVAPPAAEARRATKAAAAVRDALGRSNTRKNQDGKESQEAKASDGPLASPEKCSSQDEVDTPEGDTLGTQGAGGSDVVDVGSDNTVPAQGNATVSDGGSKTVTFEESSNTKIFEKSPIGHGENNHDHRDDEVSYNDHNNKLDVHLAVKRRVRDGALLAIQVDSTLSKVEMLIASQVVPYLVHLAAGMEYCFFKDRGFEDPLRHPDDHSDHNDQLENEDEKGEALHKINVPMDDDLKDRDGGDGTESVHKENISPQGPLQTTTTSAAEQPEGFCSAIKNDEVTTNTDLAYGEKTPNAILELAETEVDTSSEAAEATEMATSVLPKHNEPTKPTAGESDNDTEHTIAVLTSSSMKREGKANANNAGIDANSNEIGNYDQTATEDDHTVTTEDGTVTLSVVRGDANDDGSHDNPSAEGPQTENKKVSTIAEGGEANDAENDSMAEARAVPQQSTLGSFARLSKPFSALFSRKATSTANVNEQRQLEPTVITGDNGFAQKSKPGGEESAADIQIEVVALKNAESDPTVEIKINGNTGDGAFGESADEVSGRENAGIAEEDVISLLAEAAGDTISEDSISTTAMQQLTADSANFAKSITSLFAKSPQPPDSARKATAVESTDTINASRVDRPVMMLPNGLAIYEKLSLSVSVDRAIVRGTYPLNETSRASQGRDQQMEPEVPKPPRLHEGYMQADAKGIVLDMIWPKSNLEKGGYVQLSVSHMSMQERYGQRIRTIVAAGVQQDSVSAKPLEKAATCPPEVLRVCSFPSFEDRAMRDDPLDIRNTFPTQAIGLKMTIDVVRRRRPTSSSSSPTSMMTRGDGPEEQLPLSSSSLRANQDSDASSAARHDTGEVVDVFKVTNELGVDQFNAVLDSDAMCRALRLALNEEGGGFDSRWFSGDWTDQLTTDMLVHPNQPLELQNHLQSKREVFLDENAFVSSDLFNVNARIKNCEICIPAAIHQNVRSCDIVSNVDETLLTVSSELPLTVMSGKIGSSSKRDGGDVETTERIDFPNDPSDTAYEIGSAEDPAKEKSCDADVTSSHHKSKSSFRLQLELRGLAQKIIPVIPFHVGQEPQTLCSPTSMTMMFCFEGEPPEPPNSNLIKMVISSFVHIHRMHVNSDLELLAGALSTCLHHYHVVKDSVLCADTLFPASTTSTLNPPGRDEEASKSPTYSSSGIKVSLRGRRILVHKQFHQSRKTGGLSVAVCFKVDEFGCSLWRQNVSLVSPFRPPQQDGSTKVGRGRILLPLLKLVGCQIQRLEVGVEIAFRSTNRRVVAKCGVSELLLELCDLAKVGESASDQNDVAFDEDGEIDKANTVGSAVPMIEVISLGLNIPNGQPVSSREECILLRLEEQFGPFRSRSVSLDVATGGIVNLFIDDLEMACLLVLDALLMPTNSRKNSSDLAEMGRTIISFPGSSVGAFFSSLLPGTIGSSHGIMRLCQIAMAIALPEDLGLLLVRLRLVGMLVTVPDATKRRQGRVAVTTSQRLGLLLDQVELLSWYFSSNDGYHNEMLDVLAERGKRWASLLQNRDQGLSHVISSRQGIYFVDNSNEDHLCELVPKFEVSCTYLRAKLSTTIDNTLSIQDMDKLLSICIFVRQFAERVCTVYSHLRRKLVAMKLLQADVCASNEEKKEYKYQNPVDSARSDVENSISMATDLLRRLGDAFECREVMQTMLLAQRDAELDKLRRQVFTKENERFAAVALVSSQVTGWLRVGGTHQSGQRTASTSTLWTYWAVLRKALIVLYNGPGLHQPVDFVTLRGAKLQALAGGRSKHDLKRAFGIVESSGKTRFVVVGSDSDYSAWTREIEKAIVLYDIGTPSAFIDGLSGGLVDLSHPNLSGDSNSKTMEPNNILLSDLGAAASMERTMQKAMTSSAAALKKMDASAAASAAASMERSMQKAIDVSAAAFKKMDAASMERSMQKARDASAAALKAVILSPTPTLSPSSGTSETKGRSRLAGLGSVLRMSRGEDQKLLLDKGSVQRCSETVANESAAADAVVTKNAYGTSPTNANEAPSVASARIPLLEHSPLGGTIPVEEEIDDSIKSPDNQSRQLQLRGKVSGVGQRGAAILSGSRRVSNLPTVSVENALHVISEKEDEEHRPICQQIAPQVNAITWTCAQCTFINEQQVDHTDPDIFVCAMCDFPAARGDVVIDEATASSDDAKVSRDTNNTALQGGTLDLPALGQSDSDRGIFRLSHSEVAAGRGRTDSTDSDRALFLRQSSDSIFDYIEDDETSVVSDLAFDDSEAAGTGGRRRGMRDRFAGALGGVRRGRPSRPGAVPAASSEPEGKGWFGRRGSTTSNQDTGEEISKPPAPLKLKDTRVDASVDVVLDGTLSIADTSLHTLRGHWFALVKPESQVLVGDERCRLAPASMSEGNKEPTQPTEKLDPFLHALALAPSDSGVDENASVTERSQRTKSVDGDAASAAKHGGSVQSLQSTEEASTKVLFRIQLFQQGPSDNLRQPKTEVVKRLAEVIKLHAALSESISKVIQHPLCQVSTFERTSSGDLSNGLKNLLGLSPMDSLQISSKLLAGLLDPSVSARGAHKAQDHYAEVIMEFLNSSLSCPLPTKGLCVLTHFLGMSDSATANLECSWPNPLEGDNILRATSTISDDAAQPNAASTTLKASADIFALASICQVELMRAERLGRLAHRLECTSPCEGPPYTSEAATTAFPEPLLPTYVTDHLQEAIHVALIKVMAERDEAHAQLVSSSVLHSHIVEQEKKKIERLKANLEVATKAQRAVNAPSLFANNKIQEEIREREKLRRIDMEMQQNSDAELIAICHQLSSEISSRTKSALEVIRLKESRSIEREHELAEKDALKRELVRVKEMLRIEQQKAKDAQEQANRWKQSYQKVSEKHYIQNGL